VECGVRLGSIYVCAIYKQPTANAAHLDAVALVAAALAVVQRVLRQEDHRRADLRLLALRDKAIPVVEARREDATQQSTEYKYECEI
jgi:hypothetical protein